MYKFKKKYIYIYRFGLVSLRFADLAADNRPANFVNGKSLPIITPGTFGGAFGGWIGTVSSGFVDVGELLNRPSGMCIPFIVTLVHLIILIYLITVVLLGYTVDLCPR